MWIQTSMFYVLRYPSYVTGPSPFISSRLYIFRDRAQKKIKNLCLRSSQEGGCQVHPPHSLRRAPGHWHWVPTGVRCGRRSTPPVDRSLFLTVAWFLVHLRRCLGSTPRRNWNRSSTGARDRRKVHTGRWRLLSAVLSNPLGGSPARSGPLK